MKRLLAVWLCILMLPIPFAAAEAEEPDRNETGVPDPNWVLWEEPEDAVEAFAQDGDAPVFYGMQPLSRYAQVHSVTDEDLLLAARVAYLEAGGTNERAYRAVLCVLYNRCVAPRFGGKVTDIHVETYRKGQFSVIHHKGFKTLEPPEAIIEAARDIFVYGNLDLPENILFFCAARLGKGWGGRRFYKNIGGNLFFYGSVD
ncbi:MAG: cell wall hydrolase [Clostridia bacterium]|nr:cell wall hydrolase [Clostridia bacterium]